MKSVCKTVAQQWGQGKKGSQKVPLPLHESKYSKKKRADLLINFDPRPKKFRKTTSKELNKFVSSLKYSPIRTMWQDIIPYKYEDFELDDEEIKLLQTQRDHYLQNLKVQIQPFEEDLLTTFHVVHVTGSECQARSNIWFAHRKLKITASRFKEFLTQPESSTRKLLWEEAVDLSKVVSVQWGIQKENEAIDILETLYGKITKTGFFISRYHPWLGASPDGLLGTTHVIEIKCPYILRSCEPSQLDNLTSQQRSSHFNELTDHGGLRLRRNHPYFWQVQCQMYVLGIYKALFVT